MDPFDRIFLEVERMRDMFQKLHDLDNKVDHYGFAAWLIMTATLKKLLKTGRINQEELEEILGDVAEMWPGIPMILAEDLESMLDLTFKIATDTIADTDSSEESSAEPSSDPS
jgi:hypothetical protein